MPIQIFHSIVEKTVNVPVPRSSEEVVGICKGRGDAAPATFDRNLSHYRDEISDLRNQGIHGRPVVWTADGRPHPAVTRTLQYPTDIASSQNGQHLSSAGRMAPRQYHFRALNH